LHKNNFFCPLDHTTQEIYLLHGKLHNSFLGVCCGHVCAAMGFDKLSDNWQALAITPGIWEFKNIGTAIGSFGDIHHISAHPYVEAIDPPISNSAELHLGATGIRYYLQTHVSHLDAFIRHDPMALLVIPIICFNTNTGISGGSGLNAW
jgi:hypothetical protein